MTTNDGPILIGLGCSTAASATEIILLVQDCLDEARCRPDQIVAFASHRRKLGSRPLIDTARHFGAPLFFLGDDDLPSGMVSTCEATAAAAGPLCLPKRKSRYATCAIARCLPGFALERWAQPASAAMAASTLSTSVAAP